MCMYYVYVIYIMYVQRIGTWTNVGQTNVGQDKRRTGQTWDRQTSDRTNVGQGQT